MTQIFKRLPYLIIPFVLIWMMYYLPSFRCVSISNILSLLLLGYVLFKIQGRLITPFNLLMACLYLFHSGHLWISLFRSDITAFVYELRYIGDINTAISVYRDITSILIIFMSVGVLALKECKPAKQHNFVVNSNVHVIILLLFIISMGTEVVRASHVAAVGYAAGFQYSSSFALILADFVNILLYIMLYICRKNKKYFRRYMLMLLFRAFFVMILVGNRGASVVNLLVALFLLFNYSYLSDNKAFKKRILAYSVMVMLVLLPFISITRGGESSSGFQGNNPFEYFFMEFGETAWNVFLAKDYIDTYSPLYGIQMALSTLTIIPMSTLFFGDMLLTYGSIGQMLNDFMGYGNLGGSLISQLYMNFGNTNLLYISVVLMAWLFVWVSNVLMTKELNLNRLIIFLSLFAGCMTSIRAEWYSTMSFFKISIYLVVILYFFRQSKVLQIREVK